MPLIAVNMSDKILSEVRDLVEKGRYASLESFVEIGTFNQLALERGATPAEIVERGHRHHPTESAPAPSPRASGVSKSVSRRTRTKAAKRAPADQPARVEIIESVTPAEASAVFSRFTRPVGNALPSPIPMPAKANSGERIFGQVNRLFPIKLICRWLAHVAAIDRQWPKFTSIAAKLADDAGTIGSLLDDWDKGQARERGAELATALPRRKNNASLDRFLSQFVARITRASEISPGAACQYALARFDDSALGLTEQGIAFAMIENPILDAQDQRVVAALSEPETVFAATHIRTWVPTEWTDMRVILEAVRGGKTSPAEVATSVRAHLPSEWTDSMVQTHVSGVIARLSDIRLLRRSWQGRNVRYELGTSGDVNNFLSIPAERNA